jgi:hypothetical protein
MNVIKPRVIMTVVIKLYVIMYILTILYLSALCYSAECHLYECHSTEKVIMRRDIILDLIMLIVISPSVIVHYDFILCASLYPMSLG